MAANHPRPVQTRPGQSEGPNGAAPPRPALYCVVPRDLSPNLFEALRRHYGDDPNVHVIMDRRAAPLEAGDRPAGRERRGLEPHRLSAVPEQVGQLPRQLRRHAGRLLFVEAGEIAGRRARNEEGNRLAARYQAGDARAMDEIYLRFFDLVSGYARGFVRNREDAEDVAQEVFTRLMTAIARYKVGGPSPFVGWLLLITRNAAVDVLRLNGRELPHDPAELDERVESAGGAEEDAEIVAVLDRLSPSDLSFLIGRLPEAQREVMQMRYDLDLELDEIAATLGKQRNAVDQLHSRGLRTLKSKLDAVERRRSAPSSRRRMPTLTRLKPAPVLTGRRFALSRSPGNPRAFASPASRWSTRRW